VTDFVFTAVRAHQVPGRTILAFAAKPSQVLAMAEIERVARESDGTLKGFQRHQVAAHIKEIRDYLAHDSALLPNAVVLAFIKGVEVRHRADGTSELTVRLEDGEKPGYVVDGQQRLSALSGLHKPDFQIFVTAIVCQDYDEMREHFIRINSTRPLPKALIYELLPTVDGLPDRYSSRQFAAKIVAMLNFVEGAGADTTNSDSAVHRAQVSKSPKASKVGTLEKPPLFERIKQHTNPTGTISDIALQKLIINSISDGFLRELLSEAGPHETDAYLVINAFFDAVREVFREAWVDMTPKTSRLVHGAGIVAMGFVMELLLSRSRHPIESIREKPEMIRTEFVRGLRVLQGETAWTAGYWHFGKDNVRAWNAIQNTPTDISLLANYLVGTLRKKLPSKSTSEAA
jgi:DGQHR domain-containing protein